MRVPASIWLMVYRGMSEIELSKLVARFGSCVLAALAFLSAPAFANCDVPGSNQEAISCLAQDLRDSDKRINAVYKLLMDSKDKAGKLALRDEQRAWLKARDKACALDNKEPDREKWLQAITASQTKTICVVQHTFARVAQLDAQLGEQGGGATAANLPTAPKPVTFAPSADRQATTPAHDLSSLTFGPFGRTSAVDNRGTHEKGKWYYEFWIDRDSIAEMGDLLVTPGFSSMRHAVIRIVNIRRSQRGQGAIQVGLALDLDNGFVYVRQNGQWRVPPGGADAVAMELGSAYFVKVDASSDLGELFRRGLLRINIGHAPFAEPIPDGFRPWKEK